MKFAYLKPTDKVADFVQEVLVMEHDRAEGPFVLPLFANGMPTLLFHTAKGLINNSSNYLTLFGQTVSPATLRINGSFRLVAYFLKPQALIALCGFSAKELTDNPLDLENMLPGNMKSLREQLLNTASIDTMIGLLDDFIFKLITKRNAHDRLITYATATISQNPFGKVLSDVQKDLCVTERSFQRLFDQHVGVSPVQFRRICQFNNAFQQLNRQRSDALTDITFRHGYADQSHYIRAFKEFTSLTPTEYLSLGTPPA